MRHHCAFSSAAFSLAAAAAAASFRLCSRLRGEQQCVSVSGRRALLTAREPAALVTRRAKFHAPGHDGEDYQPHIEHAEERLRAHYYEPIDCVVLLRRVPEPVLQERAVSRARFQAGIFDLRRFDDGEGGRAAARMA